MAKNNKQEFHEQKVAKPVEDIIAEEPVEKIGVVSNCEKLNVRVAPRLDADVLTIIDKNTEVVLCEKQPKKDWYRVRIEDGTEGFCMKEYISVQ